MGGRGGSSGISSRNTSKSLADYENLKPLSDTEIKDLYYSSGQQADAAKYYKNNVELMDKDNKYYAIRINESLPKLQGSEKQVSWAKNIRLKAITSDIDRAVNNIKHLSIEQRKNLIKEVNKRYGTHYTTISQVISRTMKENSGYKKYGMTNSAKEIIEKR